jgi:multidrug efflux system outer membrane protein
MRRSIAWCALALLGGCKLGPDYERPQIETPEAFLQPAAEGESLATLPWWEVYQDPALQELIRIALAENQDLRAAAWRVEEARARLGFTHADELPSFTYAGSASHTNPSNRFAGQGGGSFETYRAGVGAFWEIDL